MVQRVGLRRMVRFGYKVELEWINEKAMVRGLASDRESEEEDETHWWLRSSGSTTRFSRNWMP